MIQKIIIATLDALAYVRAVRYFKSERGYQGRFFCALQNSLDDKHILNHQIILEMEYQKTDSRHNTSQRPDIILHIPIEISNSSVSENNFSVWALKRRANESRAIEDFGKLNIMFSQLRYPLGFFINIDSTQNFFNVYSGDYRNHLHILAVNLKDRQISIIHSYLKDDEIVNENIIYN